MFTSSEELFSQEARSQYSDTSYTPSQVDSASQHLPKKTERDKLFLVTFAAIQSLFV
jgi:hypothetical protein